MCLIAIKKPNVKIDYDLLHMAFVNNPDGAGLAWRLHDGIAFRKGFMDWNSLNEFIKINIEILESTEVVFHFRYATVGAKSPAMTHPFCIEDIKALHGKTRIGVLFHNGHISGLGDGLLSDTAILVKNYIAPLKKLINKESVLALLELAFKGQKIAIMTPKNTYLIGEFLESKVYKGWLFSNTSYLFDSDWDWDWEKGSEEIPE